MITALFTKPPDCVSQAGMVFTECSPIHDQWTLFSVLHGTASNHAATTDRCFGGGPELKLRW